MTSVRPLHMRKKLPRRNPRFPSHRFLLGRALVETGDVRAGTELLEKELKLQPDNLEIHFALAKAYSKTGRKEDARRERLLCLQREKSATTPGGASLESRLRFCAAF